MNEPVPEPLTTVVVHEVPAWRIRLSGGALAPTRTTTESRSEPVIVEAAVGLTVNGRTLVRFTCLPDRLDDLSVGFLMTEGLIKDAGQIKGLEVGTEEIRVQADVEFETLLSFLETVTTVSGRGRTGAAGLGEGAVPLETEASFSAGACLAMMHELEQSSQLFRTTGGVHLASLSAGDRLLDVAEDIGRHNAVDKVIGKALRGPQESADRPGLGQLMLLTTGRLSSEIVSKAYRVGLPLAVSRSAPTTKAVEIAQQADLCLVGFARGRRLNVYSAPRRLGVSADHPSSGADR